MKKIIIKVFAYLFSFSFVLTLLITSIDYNSFNKNFYEEEFSKINNAETIKTTEAELLDFCFVVLDYLQDSRDDMVTYATIDNQYTEVFNQREKLHMVDVKVLYLKAIDLRNIALITMIISLISYLLLSNRKYKILADAYIRTLVIIIVIFAALIFYAILDFTNFWYNFHYLFFDNDLWLLDPRTSIMINMVPQQFFNDLVMKIVAYFIIPIISLLAIVLVNKRRLTIINQEKIDKKI
jgi:integral membrane protein (TIGR01906 family)